MTTDISGFDHKSSVLDADRGDAIGFGLSLVLPVAGFVIANGLGEIVGVRALYFVPFGLPAWGGMVLLLLGLPLLGAARWLVSMHGARGRVAGWWLVALIAAVIINPFLGHLDSLLVSIAAMALVVLGLGTAIRVAAVDRRAALLLIPAVGWSGLSAFVSMSLATTWTPPFALSSTQSFG